MVFDHLTDVLAPENLEHLEAAPGKFSGHRSKLGSGMKEEKLSPEFDDALAFVARLHRDQFRKGTGIPYVSHLMSVSSLIMEFGGTETEAIAGLLHDAIEDQGGDRIRKVIQKRYGDDVTKIVVACTDADTIPKPPWRERKEAYIAHLETAPDSVRLVSGCDKLHNARAILLDYREHGEKLWSRFKGGKDGSLWYYRTITDILLKEGPNQLAAELDRVVTEIERLAGV